MPRLVILLVAALAAPPTFAQTADVIKEGGGLLQANTVQTVEYDIRPLLYKPGSARAGFDSVEQVIREVAANIGPGTWNKPNREIGEKNGTHLVVTASASCHSEIATLLKVLIDRTDLAVDVSGTVYELDRKTYESELLPKLDKRKPDLGRPVEASDESVKWVEKNGQKVTDGTSRIATGRTASVVSKRKAVEYLGGGGKQKPGEAFDLEFVGTTISAAVRVPRERRSVIVSVTETTRELVEILKGRKDDELRGVISLAETPKVAEVVVKSDAGEVADGAALLVPLSGSGKDKVRVLILRPIIFIQAEEDAIKKAEAEKQKK